MAAGVPQVELIRRTDPIFYIIEDRWSDVSSVYEGMTPGFATPTSEAKWLIKRQTFDGSKIVTEFANLGKWNNIWDNRASYFGPPGGTPFPYNSVSISGSVTGVFTPQGLSIAGKMTPVTLNSATWTALPATPLTNRNAIRIQNQSAIEIKTQYDNTTVGYVGIIVSANGSDAYDIKENIVIYAKSANGTPTVMVEELS